MESMWCLCFWGWNRLRNSMKSWVLAPKECIFARILVTCFFSILEWNCLRRMNLWNMFVHIWLSFWGGEEWRLSAEMGEVKVWCWFGWECEQDGGSQGCSSIWIWFHFSRWMEFCRNLSYPLFYSIMSRLFYFHPLNLSHFFLQKPG